jgi:hypothetical protein
MFRRKTPYLLLFFALARAVAQPAPARPPIERDLKRLDAALEELSHGGDRTESRRPLAAIFDALSRDAAELSRTERDVTPQRRRELDRFERDAADAARAEREFWKGGGTARPTLPSADVAELRGTKERLARDLDEESIGRAGAATTRQAPTAAQAAALEARAQAARTQEQAAGARVKRSLQNPWDEKTGAAAGSATSQLPAGPPPAAPTDGCPQCNAQNRPAGLHTNAVPNLAAKPPEPRGFWGSLYDDVAGPVSSAYSKAVFVKRKVEEATGPVASGVLEGVAETAAGITIGALLWALGKLVGKLVLGGLLSEWGVGEVILAATLKTILIGLGVVLTGMQILAMARAFSRWRSAEPGTAESTNALRDFVRSATVAVLAIALAVIGINSGKPKVPRPNEPTPPPITDTPPPPPTEGVGGNLSKIKPPEPPPEAEPEPQRQTQTKTAQKPTTPNPYRPGRLSKASEWKAWAEEQGWTVRQTENGPPKYYDENGQVRLQIKSGSARTPGSEAPHIELRDAEGRYIDPKTGDPVPRRSVENHSSIDWDL